MLKSSVRIVFKNLFKTKVYSAISILGLAIGIAIFLVGLVYLNHEWSYESGFSDYEYIYRIESMRLNGKTGLLIPSSVTNVFKEKPEVRILTRFTESSLIQPLLKAVESQKSIYIEHLYHADTNFFKVFKFPFIYGSMDRAFDYPNAVILSKRVSQNLFNNIDPIGKTISIGDAGMFIINGVFDETQFPTHLIPDAIQLTAPAVAGAAPFNSFAYTYAKIAKKTNFTALQKNLTDLYIRQIYPDEKAKRSENSVNSVILRPIKDVYLSSHSEQELSGSGNKTILWLITCLCVFMLAISAINFTNFMIAAAPSRAKEIAIRRVLGTTSSDIFKQLYFEVFINCFVAVIIAIILVLATRPLLSDILPGNFFSFQGNSFLLLIQLGILIGLLVLITGTYPILYLFFFKTVNVLKGNFANSIKGNRVRNALLVAQFSITSIFIIGFLIMSTQIKFLRNKDLGFQPDHVLAIVPGQIQTQFKYDYIKGELKNLPGVEYISYASTIGNRSEKTSYSLTVNGEELKSQYLCVDSNYFKLMKGVFISGSNFSSNVSDSLGTVIINKQLADELKITNLDNSPRAIFFDANVRIIGIVNNLNFYGFEEKASPMVFTTMKKTLTPFILARINSKNIASTIGSIETFWKSVEPGYPMRYQFLNESFSNLYKSYNALNKISSFFTVSAILLTLFGLFSIVATITTQRSKEFAIRKVLGASLFDILALLNKKIIWLILVANLLAWPIAYYLAYQWLDNFAFRINLPKLPFIFAMIVSLILTVLTVSLQTIRIVFLNQAKVLKQE